MDFYNSWKLENRFCEILLLGVGHFGLGTNGVDLGNFELKIEVLAFENLEMHIWFVLSVFLHQWENWF